MLNAKNASGKDSPAEWLFGSLLKNIDRRIGSGLSDYSQYQDDPVGFGEKVLGESFTDDQKLLIESVRDNLVTVAISANAVGKTQGSGRGVAPWFYKAFPNSQVYTTAAPPEGNLKRLLWGELIGLTEKNPSLFKDDNITTLNISRSAQSFICGVTIPISGSEAVREAKFSGKHAPYLLFIVDEGDAVPDEVYKGIESCMSGGMARLLIMFNPRSESGEVYRMIRDKRANVVHLSALNHPNVITGEDKIPGAVNRETTVRRVNQWCRPLADGESLDAECFELPEFLEGAVAKSQSGEEFPPLKPGWYKIIEPAFSYMVLGQYPARSSTKLISRSWIDQAIERWQEYVLLYGEKPPQYANAVMGLDVAEYGADANVAVFRYGGYVEKPVTWSGIDIITTADKASEYFKTKDVARCCVDATGVGAGVAPQMQRNGCSASGIKVASKPTQTTELGEFKILRDQLWWSCREWLRADPGAMLPHDELLIEELQVPTYEIQNGKIKVMDKATMRELLKRSPDRADALCLTFAPLGYFANCDLS